MNLLGAAAAGVRKRPAAAPRGQTPWRIGSLGRLPIRAQLAAYILAFLLIIAGLGALSVVTLSNITATANALETKWLASSQLLGRLGEEVTLFRLAETYRALDVDTTRLARDESMANLHRANVDLLVSRYRALMGADTDTADLGVFARAWQTYLEAHDDWTRSDSDGLNDEPAYLTSSLHILYRKADAAIIALISQNRARVHTVTAEASRQERKASITILGAAVLAVGLAAWAFMRARATIILPLRAITVALTRLAAGQPGITVPGVHRHDEIGRMAVAVDIFRSKAMALRDAHEAVRVARQEADALARHDGLTGLYNRRIFRAELEAALEAETEPGTGSPSGAVMLIDLDRLKRINDLFGHAMGDTLLCEIAERLRAASPEDSIVARLGGDKFGILVTGCATSGQASQIAARILAAIRRPITAGATLIEIGAHLGVAMFPADGTQADRLLSAADTAMVRASRDNALGLRFFEQSMDDELRARALLEVALRQAIGDQVIVPFYQPLVDLGSGKLHGFEALARWTHPDHGSVSPALFIPLAEELGLIGDLTEQILRRVCRDARQWPADIRLSVNVSPRQFRSQNLPAQILGILAEEGMPPSRVEIEVTETALVEDEDAARVILSALRRAGVTVALDDFGTGYSSLHHLHRLPFDRVKIDRSFVQWMARDVESDKIIEAILVLAKGLGLSAVAEGIEDEPTLARLKRKGCDFGQGYLFGRPMPAAEASKMVRGR